ncbi:MAG: MTH938/NDUFAF3 family protein [Wenzhouxiangellaceae bacterium]
MPLNLEQPDGHLFIRRISERGITVVDDLIEQSFIITPDELRRDWTVTDAADLDEQTLSPLLELNPELVILGTGPQQIFPPPALLMPFMQQGIGVEVMNTDAACRTFNICVSENRRVVAGMIFNRQLGCYY